MVIYENSILSLTLQHLASPHPYFPITLPFIALWVGLLNSNITALWIGKLGRASSGDWTADINGGGVQSAECGLASILEGSAI